MPIKFGVRGIVFKFNMQKEKKLENIIMISLT